MVEHQESDNVPAAPEVVSDLADSCRRFVEKALGVSLDYTQDTLPILDHYLGGSEDMTEEVLGLVAPACGAYFGEVVRRHFGEGEWQCPEGEYSDFRLTLPSSSIAFNPIGIAIEVALGEDVEDWGAHYQVPPADREPARAAVERLGDVTEETYYTFAIRFDVLVQIHSALTRATGS